MMVLLAGDDHPEGIRFYMATPLKDTITKRYQGSKSFRFFNDVSRIWMHLEDPKKVD